MILKRTSISGMKYFWSGHQFWTVSVVKNFPMWSNPRTLGVKSRSVTFGRSVGLFFVRSSTNGHCGRWRSWVFIFVSASISLRIFMSASFRGRMTGGKSTVSVAFWGWFFRFPLPDDNATNSITWPEQTFDLTCGHYSGIFSGTNKANYFFISEKYQ